MSTPFEQGFNAAINGLKLSANPYLGGFSADESRWDEGWARGRESLEDPEYEYETPPRDDEDIPF